MRTTGRRSIVLYILLVAFAAGLAWLVISLVMNGGKWAMQPYNAHLGTAAMGEITDRDGNVLAKSVDGQRVYSENELVRRALLHTIGDNEGFISTSVQATMRSQLSGYNLITGANQTIFSSLGSNVKLSISEKVSMDAYNTLGDRKGAIFVYNYETGDVLCKVSKPSYDPYNPPSTEDVEGNSAYDGIYLDRNLSASFAPGSIFKLVTQAAAMDAYSDWATREYTCNGSADIGGSEITCLHGTAHGTQNASQALGNSCNVYYAMLANDLGADALQKKAEAFGWNEDLRFGNAECSVSGINLSAANSNQLGWAGVGQYTVMANPYHMLTLMGAIANGGTYNEPHISSSWNPFEGLTGGSRSYMSSTQADALKTMMRSNVANYYGDYLFPEGMNVCAKSGTAEVDGKDPTCWFVGFSDNASTPYAFVVVVEEGLGGIESAGNAASAVMNSVVSNIK